MGIALKMIDLLQLTPDMERFTLGQVRDLQMEVSKLKTVGEFKKHLTKFKDRHGLTSADAINLTKIKSDPLITSEQIK